MKYQKPLVSNYSDYLKNAHLEVNAQITDPKRIYEIRTKLNLTQQEAGALFGGGVNAFSRYETGKTKPPLALVQLFKLLDSQPELLPNMDGQAHVVALRFALVAATLELAARYGITGLPTGNAFTTIKQCFDDWLERNGSGKYEDKQILEQAIAFMQQHAKGMRFSDWNDTYTNANHAGFRRRAANEELDEYFVIPAVFEQEICGTFDRNKVCAVLSSLNWLDRPKGKRTFLFQFRRGNFYKFVGMVPIDANKEYEQ